MRQCGWRTAFHWGMIESKHDTLTHTDRLSRSIQVVVEIEFRIVSLALCLSLSLNKVDALERVAYGSMNVGFFSSLCIPMSTFAHSFCLAHILSLAVVVVVHRSLMACLCISSLCLRSRTITYDARKQRSTYYDDNDDGAGDARGLLINLSVGLFDRAD